MDTNISDQPEHLRILFKTKECPDQTARSYKTVRSAGTDLSLHWA